MKFKKLSLSITYWIAFAILAMWASFTFYTMHSLISSQEQYGKLINLSGKQRMLSQKCALYAHISAEHNNTSAKTHLQSLLKLMQSDYDFIKNNLTSEETREYYFSKNGLDSQVNQYFNLIQNYLNDNDIEMIKQITSQSQPLLKHLNEAVYMFEDENNAIVKELHDRELFIFLGTMLTLIFEALVIIRPMIVAHKDYLKNLERKVRERTKELYIYKKIYDNSKEGVVITDKNLRIINVNEAFTSITGYSKDETIGNTPGILKSGKHSKSFYKDMWKSIEKDNIWQGEILNKRKNSQELYENLTIMKIEDEFELNYVSIFSDITDKIYKEKELHHLASHDALTGMYNRSEIMNRIDHAIDLCERNNKLLSILFIDLDNFKIVNDSLGHNVGDKLLIEVSKKLAKVLRKSDTIGRLGGDEFLILLESLDAKGEERIAVDKILDIFHHEIIIENKALNVGASIGVVFYPDINSNIASSQNLIRRADIAMYKAKELGKNRVSYYSEEMNNKIQSRMLMSNKFAQALKDRELELYLQPKIDIATGLIKGAEALLRWNHEGKIVSPDVFIPIAEENNLIKEIDRWVVQEALQHLQSIQYFGHKNFKLALNLSGRTFSDRLFMEELLNIIHESGNASHIEIEITEGSLIENFTFASIIIEQIKSFDISLSLDDFGTGYSSFSYLSKLPIDTIKIDRSFIQSLHYEKDKILVESIISISQKLKLDIVAEGVETKEQLNWLRNEKCSTAQGYLFSKPIQLSAMQNLLEEKKNFLL
jgi:diguanylate cyclase (GGDEF)-like protein/PAS domain S-box-containing protein